MASTEAKAVGHTPGPWTMRTVPTSAGVCHRVYPEAWVDPPSHGGICLYDDRTSLNPHPEGVQLANARLIAAAPELLEALERCEELGRRFGRLDIESVAHNAIAKARRTNG